MIAVEIKVRPWLYGWELSLYVNGKYIAKEFVKDINDYSNHTEILLEKA